MIPHEPTSIVIVIDTDQYAGNFEREMCAFVTGQAEDGGRAGDLARKFSGSIRHLP